MYEEQRNKLRGEFPDIDTWSDQAVNHLLGVRNSAAYKATVEEQREDGRQQRAAQNAERERIQGKLDKAAEDASEELSLRRASLLGAWLRDGGTEAEFEKEWPGMRADILKDRIQQRKADYERSSYYHYKEIF